MIICLKLIQFKNKKTLCNSFGVALKKDKNKQLITKKKLTCKINFYELKQTKKKNYLGIE